MPNVRINIPGHPSDKAPCYQWPVFIKLGKKKINPRPPETPLSPKTL